MRILALDLGKDKSVSCDFESQSGGHTYQKIEMTAQELHDLIVERSPDRVVFEVGTGAGWVHDLARALNVEVQVANPSHEGWRWRNVKHKNDRLDALKLARLSSNNELPLVHMPCATVRQWRSFISYRSRLVGRRTEIKNHIRAILDRAGLRLAAAAKGWTQKSKEGLRQLTTRSDFDALWRSELSQELQALEQIEGLTREAEATLNGFAQSQQHVELLQSIPGVGPRLAETVVAFIDDPHRFRTGKQVASYAGLAPRQRQSGSQDRQGGISGQGNRLLRSLLIEVSWAGLRYNPWMRSVYERTLRGSSARRKIAIVAVARRLLIRCWAMMRSGQRWQATVALKLAS